MIEIWPTAEILDFDRLYFFDYQPINLSTHRLNIEIWWKPAWTAVRYSLSAEIWPTAEIFDEFGLLGYLGCQFF